MNAEEAGVTDRVDFQVADASSYAGRGFELICFFDALHDLGDPIGAARRAYEALADDGTLMVVEPFAGDSLLENEGTVGGSTTPPRRRCASRTRSRKASGSRSVPRPAPPA